MAKFPLYQWKKATGTGDTTGLAKLSANNTFTEKNTFENTGSIIKVKTNNNEAFGVEFDNSSNQPVAYVGAHPVSGEQKAVFYGSLGASIDTPNKDINLNSGTAHVLSNTSKNWNDHVPNSIVRQKDTQFNRKVDYTNVSTQPGDTWNYDAWKWTLNNPNITSKNGLHEFLIVFSFNDNKAVSLRASIVWKSGVPESQSQIITVEKSNETFYFQCAIRENNVFHIYHKKTGTGGQNTTISWVRVYILRDNNLPTKMSSVW